MPSPDNNQKTRVLPIRYIKIGSITIGFNNPKRNMTARENRITYCDNSRIKSTIFFQTTNTPFTTARKQLKNLRKTFKRCKNNQIHGGYKVVVNLTLVHKYKTNKVYEYNRPGMHFKVKCHKTNSTDFKWLVRITCELTSPHIHDPVHCLKHDDHIKCRVAEFYANNDEEIMNTSSKEIEEFITKYYST